MPNILPGTWVKFMNKRDEVSLPSRSLYFDEKSESKKLEVKYTVLLSAMEKTSKNVTEQAMQISRGKAFQAE